MAELDVELANLYFATAATGPWTALPEATGWAFTSDSEGETVIRTFGGGRHVRTGSDTDTYEISALLDPTGQAAMRTAKRAKTSIWIALIWEDEDPDVTTGVKNGTVQECKITSYTYEADADGDLQRASFTAVGEGDLTDVAALPTA